MMEKEKIKSLIWRLDASLTTFSGVDWMENVGRVARLKESFFRFAERFEDMPSSVSEEDWADLEHCLDILACDASPVRRRGAAFGRAADIIASLMLDEHAPPTERRECS